MTSTFKFLMVLYSIIIGTNMAQILTAVGKIIQGNKPIQPYWIHAGWVLFIFLLYVFLWFSAWQFATIQVLTLLSFLLFLTVPVILFVVSVIALPDIDPDRNYDMRIYYFRTYRWLHALLIAIIVLTAASAYLLLDQHPITLRSSARGGAALFLFVGLWFGNPKLHGIQILTLYGLIGFFALTYRGSIGG